ncbi:unnamed protein product, partial [Ixodes persulcatus]
MFSQLASRPPTLFGSHVEADVSGARAGSATAAAISDGDTWSGGSRGSRKRRSSAGTGRKAPAAWALGPAAPGRPTVPPTERAAASSSSRTGMARARRAGNPPVPFRTDLARFRAGRLPIPRTSPRDPRAPHSSPLPGRDSELPAPTRITRRRRPHPWP